LHFSSNSEAGSYKKRWRARDGRPDQEHRGAENAQPFAAQDEQAAAIREREGAAEAGPYKGAGPTYDIGEKKLYRNRKKRVHGAGIDLFVWMEAWGRRCVLI
jgi:hypothetical protein